MKISKEKTRISSIAFRIATATSFFVAISAVAAVFLPNTALGAERYVAMPIRALASFFSSLVSLPLFELLILFLPIILMLLLVFIGKGSARRAAESCILLLEALILLYSASLVIPTAASYGRYIAPSATDVDYLGGIYALSVNLGESDFELVGDFSEIKHGVLSAVEDYAKEEGIKYSPPAVKISLMPELLTAAGMLAHYSFISAEITLNGLQPAYMLAFTLAHEAAHFLGITREDEANLFAFSALFESDFPFLRYSAALRGFEYLASPAYSLSREEYGLAYSRLSDFAKNDLIASSAFSENLGHGRLGGISSSINDSVISMRDERGNSSYKNSAALIAAYLASRLGN